MSESEFQSWKAFHALHPIDDHHRIYLPAAVIAARMGGDFEATLAFLSNQSKPKRSVGRVTVVGK